MTLEWHARGACVGKPTWWWELHTGRTTEFNMKAKALCKTCPVKDKCLEYGIKTRATGFIFGGRMFGTKRANRPKGS